MPKLFAIILFSTFTFAAVQTTTPTVTPEMRAKYWRAQAEAMAAAKQAENANTKLQSAQVEMVKACGDLQLIAGPDGEPTCQAKPEAANAK